MIFRQGNKFEEDLDRPKNKGFQKFMKMFILMQKSIENHMPQYKIPNLSSKKIKSEQRKFAHVQKLAIIKKSTFFG